MIWAANTSGVTPADMTGIIIATAGLVSSIAGLMNVIRLWRHKSEHHPHEHGQEEIMRALAEAYLEERNHDGPHDGGAASS
jgi:hypothetical protein